MTNEVNDTHLMRLVFRDLKKYEILHCHMKQLNLISKCLHFNVKILYHVHYKQTGLCAVLKK